MLIDFFILMKSELAVTAVIFVLLFIKIGKGMKNEFLLPLIQVFLLANFLLGFFFNKEGVLFEGAYNATPLIVFQKNIFALDCPMTATTCL